MGYFKTHLIQFALIGITISFVSDQVLAQSAQTNTQLNYMPQPGVQLPIPSPESQSGFNTPPRRMERTGTAINGARNSVSIKSTDAGIIHYPPAVSAIPRPQHDLSAMHRHSQSNCINCGTIDFIRIIDQERLFDAVTSGVIAGTVIRKMNGNSTHPLHRGQHPQYHMGIRMNNGSQHIISAPDASHLQQGDNVQLIDNVTGPDTRQ